MTVVKTIFYILGAAIFTSCYQQHDKKIILVKNSLDIKRSFETVELTKEFLEVEELTTSLGIRDEDSGELAITQLVDINDDGVMDQLLFQPKVNPNSEKRYELIQLNNQKAPKSIDFCFSRFVPERTDDYAWENDKIAFRVYGPTAQKMIEENIPGGTLSSGVDAWLKKVNYPIINKWYKKTTNGTGSYHEDTGEGLDNFHVGISRGVGGIAIKNKEKYYFSKNFSEWKTITTGPLRTSFYLKYEDWDANGKKIQESKIISLDYGNNFSKFNVSLKGSETIAAGLTLHEKDGKVTNSKSDGWVSYYQPHGRSEIGTAIIAPKKYFINSETYNTNTKDLSNAYCNLKVINNNAVYYAGFGWKESKQFKNQQEWESYLNSFSKKINNPMTVLLYK